MPIVHTRRAAFLVTFAVLVPMAAAAQTGTGTITGEIRDASGGAIPGASVRIISDSSAAAAEAVSDGEGVYRADVAPGRYRVEGALDGFETTVRQDIAVVSGQPARVDLVLSP